MSSLRSIFGVTALLLLGHIPVIRAQAVPRSLLASYALNTAPLPTRADTVPLFETHSDASEDGHKSPFLAAGLSAIIPGLGEYYCGEQVWRGMIFTGLEVGLWIGYAHYIQQYNDSMAGFRSFSDAHFTRGSYATFLDSALVVHKLKPVADSTDCASINRAEKELDSLGNLGVNPDPTLTDMGHQLACGDIQQYYEMISKYKQYIPGWDAVANWNEAAAKSGRMNDSFGVAQAFGWGIILNHVLSAIDAALLASDHNSKLRLRGDMILKPYPNGSLGYVPTANLQLTF